MGDTKAKDLFDQLPDAEENGSPADDLFNELSDDGEQKFKLQEEDPRGLPSTDIDLVNHNGPNAEDFKSDMNSTIMRGVEAGGRGFGQGVTVGNLDEIGAFLADPSLGEEYKQVRDEIRTNNKAAQAEFPKAYGISEGVGAMATSAVAPGGALSIPARLALGAVGGSAAAAGYSETELDENPAELGKEMVTGGLLGMGGAGIGVLAAPAQSVGGTLARMGGTGAIGAGMGALINEENPTQGAVMGAGMGVGGRGLLGVTRQLLDQDVLKKAAKYTRSGEKLSKTPAAVKQYNKELDDVAKAYQALSAKGTKIKSTELAAGLSKIDKQLDDFIVKTKAASGKNIEAFRGQLAGHEFETKKMVEDISDFLDNSFAPEEIKNQIRKKLAAVSEISLPKNAISQSTTTKFDPDSGTWYTARQSNKVSGKNVSVDELDTLKQQGPMELGDASSTDTYTPKGISRTEVQKFSVGPGAALKDASIDDLFVLKSQVAQQLNHPDPATRGLAKRTYGRISQEIEKKGAELTNPEEIAKYVAANEKYAAASTLDKGLFNRSGNLSIEDQVLGYEGGKVNTNFPEINKRLAEVQALEDGVLLPGGTQGTSKHLEQTISDTSAAAGQAKALESVANPSTGEQVAKNQILGMSKDFNKGPIESNLNLLKSVDADAVTQVEQQSQRISDIADMLDLNKVGFGRDNVMPPLTPRGAVNWATESRKAGSVEAGKLIGGAQRGFDQMMNKVENLPVLGQVAQSKGFNMLAQALKNAASKDSVGRAVTLWTIKNNAGYRKQIAELESSEELKDLIKSIQEEETE